MCVCVFVQRCDARARDSYIVRPRSPSPDDTPEVLRVVAVPIPAPRDVYRLLGVIAVVLGDVVGGEEVDIVEDVRVEVEGGAVLGDVVTDVEELATVELKGRK